MASKVFCLLFVFATLVVSSYADCPALTSSNAGVSGTWDVPKFPNVPCTTLPCNYQGSFIINGQGMDSFTSMTASGCCTKCANSKKGCTYWQEVGSVCFLYYGGTPSCSGASLIVSQCGIGGASCQGSAVKGDPHFTGGDGSHFDFTGAPNQNYCLITDSHLNINAFFGGRYGEWEGRYRALNWIRQVGILWGHHTILFSARQGASWQYGNGYLERIEVDGEEVVLAQPGDVTGLAGGKIVVEWREAKALSGDDDVDVYGIRIPGIMEMELVLRPEVADLRTPEDGTVHIDLTFPVLNVSPAVHGILGETYRPDHMNRLSEQKLEHSDLLHEDVVPGDNAEGFLDLTPKAYVASDLLKADCLVSRFARFEEVDAETGEAIQTSLGSTMSFFQLRGSLKFLKALKTMKSRKLWF